MWVHVWMVDATQSVVQATNQNAQFKSGWKETHGQGGQQYGAEGFLS